MKARRNFVVEFKSGRRSQRSKNASIWGDTDLKAIAREVEKQTPHTFQQPDRLVATGEQLSPPQVGDIVVAGGHQGAEPAVTIAPVEELAIPVAAVEPAQPQLQAAPAIEKTEDSLPAVVHSRPKRSAAPVPQSRSNIPKRRVRDAASHLSTDKDELLVLESENLRLKALLRSRLEAENARLRSMLARFS